MLHDADNAWKDILHARFHAFLEFFFPQIAAVVDTSEPPHLLDKELEPLFPSMPRGKAIVDKLARVRLRDGGDAFVFVHVEVQGYPDAAFELRMLRYNVLLRERHGENVISLAVLTDGDPAYRPNAFAYSLGDFELTMRFPTVKLIDYRGREAELSRHPSPFAIVVLAHLGKLRGSSETRQYRAKLRLIRLLLRSGRDADEIRDLLRFLDWILRLPETFEERMIERTKKKEANRDMVFLSYVERKGLEQGRQEGLRAGLIQALAVCLEMRFGAVSPAALARVEAIKDPDRLRDALAALHRSATIEEFLASIASS